MSDDRPGSGQGNNGGSHHDPHQDIAGTGLSTKMEGKPSFDSNNLDKTVIAIPLLNEFARDAKLRAASPDLAPTTYHVIIDLNLEYPGGRRGAKEKVRKMITDTVDPDVPEEGVDQIKSELTEQYLFACLTEKTIQTIARLDLVPDEDAMQKAEEHSPAPAGDPDAPHQTVFRALYRIWLDFKVRPLITKSISTVKANAAHLSFTAVGDDIVWAVMDSGIDGSHPHFQMHRNLDVESPLRHRDFTVGKPEDEKPLVDQYGHGSHVAGIIAGEARSHVPKRGEGAADGGEEGRTFYAVARHRDEAGEITYQTEPLKVVAGMAPRAKLLSLKVLDSNGGGLASNLIAAIAYVQEVNGNGRRIRIHGVNLSVGYDFEPEWFACGQSPLCVEVDRLVKTGVVVVVAAGNTGYGWGQTAYRGSVAAGLGLTINDPGNAELAITVGSTHRDMPHIYGVSYFSSKGPTGDGRVKPDIVAPGEKIISCAAGTERDKVKGKVAAGDSFDYREDSGTSMAAPHVSGVIAAFLSVRREFIGRPEDVKEIFLSTATDLKRDRYFQGRGLVDLMRAIQSV